MSEKLEKILECVKSKGKEVSIVIAASYLLGLGTGAIGKGASGDWQYVAPAILPGLDLFMGRTTFYIIPYTLGVATNYTGQIYEASKNII